MAKLTPMLKQYLDIKKQYPDALLFFRLGDFYEMFGEDAEVGARELSITLTSREAGKGRRLPMCGVPYHAADRYVATLVGKGYKVAICEQMEDPQTAKGVVHRSNPPSHPVPLPTMRCWRPSPTTIWRPLAKGPRIRAGLHGHHYRRVCRYRVHGQGSQSIAVG